MLKRSESRAKGMELVLSARGVGNTRLMMEGLNHYEGEVLLVALTRQHAEILAQEATEANPKIKVTARGLDEPPLRGTRIPVVYDHSALAQIARDLQYELGEFQQKMKVLLGG